MIQAKTSRGAYLLTGTISVGLGALGVYDLIRAVWKVSSNHEFLGGLIQACFGFLCLFIALDPWFRRSARSVRWLCTLAALVIFWFAITGVDAAYSKVTGGVHLPGNLDGPENRASVAIHGSVMLLTAILATLWCQLSGQWLLRRLDLTDDRSTSQQLWLIKVSWTIIALYAFSVGVQLSGLASEQRGRQHIDPWEGLFIFVPVAIAVAIYKIGVFAASRRIGR